MTFAYPLVLLGLLAIPLLVGWYSGQQRRRTRAAALFVAPTLAPSVVPKRPRWRRHVPMLAFALALAALVLAAARPQQTEAVPISSGAVMLTNDVSSSMLATDVTPSRLAAARSADARFVASAPSGVEVGLVEFARKPVLLQSLTTNHSLTQTALGELHSSGGTAIGDALLTALHQLANVPLHGGKRPPRAILLTSDGASNFGSDPLAAARMAAQQHIPIYTVTVGTAHGTITVKRGSQTVTGPVPPDPTQLVQIAKISGGRHFNVTDAGGLSAVYAHLAAQFGHKHVKQEITASFAGGGLVLLLLGSLLSLRWFGRLV
jgi:Ca-activated chloride channel family protein